MRQVIDIGDTVVCDLCNKDYTNSDAKGGLLFESKGVCPDCAPRLIKDAEKYGETEFIRERAEEGETFKAFCLRMRGGDNRVIITSGD